MKNKIIKTIIATCLICCMAGCADMGIDILPSEGTQFPGTTITPQEDATQGSVTTPEIVQTPVPVATPTVTPEAEPTPTATPVVTPVPTPTAIPYDGAGWGLVYQGTGVQPRGNVSPKILAEYDAYYVGSAEDKVIYLTFDCGYENGNTDPILNALKEHDVKATFFVTGNFLEKEEELLKRMVAEGHAVASHSYTHPNVTELSDIQELRKELDMVKDKFYEVTGTELAMYFRPPEGICYSPALSLSQEMGYATILWSLAHVDWNTANQPKAEDALNTLKNRIHPGAIVLLHNTSQTNGEILYDLIAAWEEMGYTIKPLSDLVGW